MKKGLTVKPYGFLAINFPNATNWQRSIGTYAGGGVQIVDKNDEVIAEFERVDYIIRMSDHERAKSLAEKAKYEEAIEKELKEWTNNHSDCCGMCHENKEEKKSKKV